MCTMEDRLGRQRGATCGQQEGVLSSIWEVGGLSSIRVVVGSLWSGMGWGTIIWWKWSGTPAEGVLWWKGNIVSWKTTSLEIMKVLEAMSYNL